MSSLGGVTFEIVHGLPANLKARVDVWQVAGIDGYGAQTLALGDAEFDLIAIAYVDDNDAANAHIAACEALQGTVTGFTDDWLDDYESLLVRHVDTTNAKKAVFFEGNFNAVRVQVTFRICSLAVQA